MPVITRQNGPEQISWSIGGVPVTMEWDNCRMVAPGGYENLSGRVTGHLQRRKLKQGARVVGTRPNGRTLYQGTLVSPPKIVNGVAYIEAEGYQAIIRRRNNRLPYVISDMSQWSQTDELPFDYTNNQKFTLQSKADGIGWLIEGDGGTHPAYAINDRAGYGLYVPGHTVQRIRATIRKTGDNANFDLEVRDAVDLGSASVVTTKTLGAGTADGTAWNVNAVNQNTVLINVIANAATTPGARLRVSLQNIQACVIADDTDWVTSDVVSDVAGRVDFADDVSISTTSIGGLDWNSGWDELLDYMAAIEDYTWLVIEDTTKGKATPKDAQLTFRPWGNKTWDTTLDMAQENLTIAPLYNQITVFYERPAGVPQHISYQPGDFSLDDPIPGLTYEYPDPPRLENPQRNTTLAAAIAGTLMPRLVNKRLVGNIKVSGLMKGRPFDIKAGDKLNVNGYDPVVPAQRIAAVTYNSDGTVDCTLERSFDIAAMLFRLTAHRRRSTPHKWGSGHRS